MWNPSRVTLTFSESHCVLLKKSFHINNGCKVILIVITLKIHADPGSCHSIIHLCIYSFIFYYISLYEELSPGRRHPDPQLLGQHTGMAEDSLKKPTVISYSLFRLNQLRSFEILAYNHTQSVLKRCCMLYFPNEVGASSVLYPKKTCWIVCWGALT